MRTPPEPVADATARFLARLAALPRAPDGAPTGAALQAQRDAVRALRIPSDHRASRLESFRLYGSRDQRRCTDRLQRAGDRYVEIWPATPALAVLYGGYGTGKTRWLWSVGYALAAALAVSGRVVRIGELARSVTETQRFSSATSETELMDRHASLGWLGLDEWSRHALGDGPLRPFMYDLVERRLENRRPTVITTNEMKATDLKALFGGALWSRLQREAVILFTGHEDYREIGYGARQADVQATREGQSNGSGEDRQGEREPGQD